MTLERFIEVYCKSNPMSEGIEHGRYGEGSTIYRGSATARCGAHEVQQSLPAGFREVHEWRDGMYAATFISDSLLSVVSYCEGDVLVSTHQTADTYRTELIACAEFYGTAVPA